MIVIKLIWKQILTKNINKDKKWVLIADLFCCIFTEAYLLLVSIQVQALILKRFVTISIIYIFKIHIKS